MSVNTAIVQGRVPFDNELKNGDDEKRAFVMFSVSSKRNFKKQDEEYYPEDLISCKAFGKTAIFISKYFPKGSDIIVEGEIRRGDDYTKDGVEQKGQMYLHVTGAHFVGGAKTENTGKSTPTQKKDKPTNPLVGKKSNPLI